MPLVLWSLAPCMPFVFWPDEMVGMGSNFLAYNGTLYAPVVGILVADFVSIRRQRLNDCALFDDDPRADYYSMKGSHRHTVTRMNLGQAVYLSLIEGLGRRIT